MEKETDDVLAGCEGYRGFTLAANFDCTSLKIKSEETRGVSSKTPFTIFANTYGVKVVSVQKPV